MKYFLDTEFSERGPRFPVQLISIGIVAEDGRELYAHSEDYNARLCNSWVKEHVLPHIQHIPQLPLKEIASIVKEFCEPGIYGIPEFWGYYADYDWVVFCQMFGTMMDLPKGFPMYCRDLKQWCDQLGNPALPAQSSVEHNALNDARWNSLAWEFLAGLASIRSHVWVGQRQGGSPADAGSYEWVRYCSVCGMTDTCEDPLPPCSGHSQGAQSVDQPPTVNDGGSEKAHSSGCRTGGECSACEKGEPDA